MVKCPSGKRKVYLVDIGQVRIVLAVTKHLCVVGFGVVNGYVGNVALCIAHCLVNGIDESFVGRKVERFVTCQNFFVQYGIDFHTIILDQTAGCFVVALALDALNFGQEFAKQIAQCGVVVDFNVGLSFFFTSSTTFCS